MRQGQGTFFMVYRIVMAALVFGAMSLLAIRIASNQIFVQQNLADDVALTMDVAHAAPGELSYAFVRNTSGYVFAIENGEVRVLVSEHANDNEVIQAGATRYGVYVPTASGERFGLGDQGSLVLRKAAPGYSLAAI